MRDAAPVERGEQRCEPGGMFVQDGEIGHCRNSLRRRRRGVNDPKLARGQAEVRVGGGIMASRGAATTIAAERTGNHDSQLGDNR